MIITSPPVPTSSMYKELSLLKFEDIHKYFLLKFLHFIIYKKPEIFAEDFACYLPNTDYQIRNSRINLPPTRRDEVKGFTVFQCCKLMREISSDLIEPQSAYSLNRKFKLATISRY